MTSVIQDNGLTDGARRARVFGGDVVTFAPTAASLRLCELARELSEDAFSPLDPEFAQFEMKVEDYAAILAALKPAFIHHPECKILIPEMLQEWGCDPDRTYFDVPRLRTSTSDGYLTTGIAYAFHPHRDTWYSAPHCQLNFWMPVYAITPDNGMTFFPKYFSRAVKNGSATYDYYRWNRESRGDAAKHIGKDTRVQPHAEEPMELEPDLRVVQPVGGAMLFSGAQMHASLENNSGRTRFSIDFRVVNEDDVRMRAGAPNVDSHCTGTTLRDFLRCSDLERLPEELVVPYDGEPPPPDAVTVYQPDVRAGG